MPNAVDRPPEHPIGSSLAFLSIGLLAFVPLWDTVSLLSDQAIFSAIGFWTVLAGVLSILWVASAGVALALPRDESNERRAAHMHRAATALVVAVYLLALAVRAGWAPIADRERLVLALDVAGLGLLSIANRVGGAFTARVDGATNASEPGRRRSARAHSGQ